MKQPGMSIGVGLVAVGCAGILFVIGWLWLMPGPQLERAPVVAQAPVTRTVEERRPSDAAPTIPANPGPEAMAPASEPVVEPLDALPEPAPQPAPAETQVATAEAAVAAPAPAAEPPPSSAPLPTAEASASAIANPAPAEPPAPAATIASPAPVQPAPAAAEAKGYRLQLGAMRTPEGAQQEWNQLQHQHGDVLGKLAYAAPRVDLGNRGVFYRIQAGPLADAAAANRACGELKRRGVSCIPVKP